MKKDCQTHNQKIREQLKQLKLKATPSRLKLLDIFEHAKKPLSIKQIGDRFSANEVDPATLYRNIEHFCSHGIVKEVHLNNKNAYYEIADRTHHHHVICEQCGKIADIEDCSVGKLESSAARLAGFAIINHHSLEFFGLCKSCAS